MLLTSGSIIQEIPIGTYYMQLTILKDILSILN